MQGISVIGSNEEGKRVAATVASVPAASPPPAVAATTTTATGSDSKSTPAAVTGTGTKSIYRRTLFYMPHCGRGLYNNVVWSNWSHDLRRVAIFGNSFSLYRERARSTTSAAADTKTKPAASIDRSIACLHAIESYTTETALPSTLLTASDALRSAFNDSSLHSFERFSAGPHSHTRPDEYIIADVNGGDPEIIPAAATATAINTDHKQ